ncbi:MAG: hypothetical protein HC835_21435 [Oscillatoriales cyanobacterium RM2_1_1]|nr:hypothetical protein [Oscillatoriales cyanobacterium SM2_3_0]NJO47950.1 hypothetical protein [Oscillatoriales cyanobacterium RM2_1_1]
MDSRAKHLVDHYGPYHSIYQQMRDAIAQFALLTDAQWQCLRKLFQGRRVANQDYIGAQQIKNPSN